MQVKLYRKLFFSLCICIFFNIHISWSFEQRITQRDAPVSYGCLSFEQPAIAFTPKNKSEVTAIHSPESLSENQNFSLEKRILKPISSGWKEVIKRPSEEDNPDAGMEQLINIITKLFNRISSTPVIPFNMATNMGLDTMDAYLLGEKKPLSMIQYLKQQFDKLLDMLFHRQAKNTINVDLFLNINTLLKLYT
jgi:hypothetical protein